MSGKRRIYVAFPCHGSATPETAHSLFMLGLYMGSHPEFEWVGFQRYSSSNLPHARTWLAQNARDENHATHILWVDSDMRFPSDSLHRLLAHGEKIVGCNYTRRAAPYTPSALDLDEKIVYTRDDSTGLEAVGILGFGLLLTDVSVFDGLPHPWFAQLDATGLCTEDVVWCKKVRAAGNTIWLDHKLSKEVGHIGSVAFTYRDAVGA